MAGPAVKTFLCECGNTLHFENTLCFGCGRAVAFLPDMRQLSALEPDMDDHWRALANGGRYRFCRNQRDYNVCNWLVPAGDPHEYCASCRLNRLIPDLGDPRNLPLWYRIEGAKRRLLYTLYGLRLTVTDRNEDPVGGLAFEFLADPQSPDEFANDDPPRHRVMTGHRTGVITINIMEAEDSVREWMRVQMNERYRTLLGHFRHESGHYYWDRLVAAGGRLESFRALFGDERADYGLAMNSYYAHGPLADWQLSWISAYASMHPWEDWAETWAHYLHLVDTLETAHDFGFSIEGRRLNAIDTSRLQAAPGYGAVASFDTLLGDWERLTVALNALNRSMGLPDAYPFTVMGQALEKLRFVHTVIHQQEGTDVRGDGFHNLSPR
jgi:hypothetical protein